LRPPAPEPDVTALVEDAVTRAREEGVEGQAVTPYVLAYLHEHSAGETLAVNRRLAADNAALAAQIASVYPRER
jgi:pseudouridine-5'-phosphate glycosidase